MTDRNVAPTAPADTVDALRAAIDAALDTVEHTDADTHWMSAIVHGDHHELVAAAIWGRWDTVHDDLFTTLPRHQGIAVSAHPTSSDDHDLITITDLDGNELARRWWHPDISTSDARDTYHQSRSAQLPTTVAVDVAAP